MMGPSHAMSGVAVWLGGVAVYSHVTDTVPTVPIILVGSIVTAGLALAPDFDSYTSTVVKSFGIFGRWIYYLVNFISVIIYNATGTRKDEDKENGHRTFFHTAIAAVLAGGLTALVTLSSGDVTVWGQTYTWGQFFGLIIMGISINLAFSGLFENFRKLRNKFGPYLMMGATVALTFLIAYLIPEAKAGYSWLGLAVTIGWLTHLFGDLITKMGVPLLWPIKIHGKRWYDVSLPSFMRIRAGGKFEYKILVPLFIIIIIAAATYNILLITGGMK